MRILQILPELSVGGVETGTVDFAKYLVQKGHASVIISNGGGMVDKVVREGSRHYKLPVHKKSLWTAFKMIGAVRKIIRDEKIDIVHARSRVPAWIAYYACRRTNAAFITTCHGYYKSKLFSQVMGWSKLVIVPSQIIGQHMSESFGVKTNCIRCIPRSVDFDRFKNLPEKPKGKSVFRITIIGRITPIKGHAFFIHAMAKVIRSMPYVKVSIVGDAPRKKPMYRREIENLVQKLGLENHVEFLGQRQDIPEILSQTDVLVMSSIYPESFGRVILEAQAANVPVVATSVGGVVDIIEHNETGLLVAPRDIDGMAKEVMRLLNDKALVNKLTGKAQEKLHKEYTLEKMAERTLAVYEELVSSMNILVIKISSVGDVVLVTASLKALRKNFPKAQIYCLVGKESRRILQNCPHVDGLILFDHKDKDQGWRGLWRITRKLRKYRFDKVIDFQNNKKSHLLAYLSFARETYGFDNGKLSFLLSNPLKNYQNDIPAVPHQFQLLKMLGIEYKDNVTLDLWPTKTDKKHVQDLLDSEWMGNAQNIVGINIAASEKWATKNWPIEYVAELCDLLMARNIRVVITGVEGDRELAQQLLSKAKSKPAILVGKTDINQLAALIEKCKVFITPDSAPQHIAAAVETPVIVLYGPTDPKRHIPPGKNMIVLNKKIKCSPCYSPKCRIKTHDCMKMIKPQEILKAVEELISVKV
jgi:lipopolysaccharide heptosyltransferase II